MLVKSVRTREDLRYADRVVDSLDELAAEDFGLG